MSTKNNSEPKLKTICVDMDPVQLAKMTPAVTFAAPNITTLSGESVSNGEIYDTFVKVNGKCVNTVMNALGSGADPRFAAAAIDIASRNIFNNIVDSFMNAICNQYAVYLNRVNLIIINMFGDINSPVSPLVFNERNNPSHYRGNIHRGLREFVNCSLVERKANFDSGALYAFAIGVVNSIGADFYNVALTKISEALSFFEGDKEFLQTKVVDELNSATGTMMFDMTYECKLFCENLYNFNSNILSHRDIDTIKYMNEPEKLNNLEKRQEECEFGDF